jgi:hypothetical protein
MLALLTRLLLPAAAMVIAPEEAAAITVDSGPTQPPSYPIPSSCDFVTPKDTGGRNINRMYGHYFCRPHGAPTKQLFVFLPGTGTNDYTSIVKTAASVGMHSVSLDWDNHPCAAAACQMKYPKGTPLNAAVANCTFQLQMSRLVGSADVPVTSVQPESIVGRTVMLLEYVSNASLPHGLLEYVESNAA